MCGQTHNVNSVRACSHLQTHNLNHGLGRDSQQYYILYLNDEIVNSSLVRPLVGGAEDRTPFW